MPITYSLRAWAGLDRGRYSLDWTGLVPNSILECPINYSLGLFTLIRCLFWSMSENLHWIQFEQEMTKIMRNVHKI